MGIGGCVTVTRDPHSSASLVRSTWGCWRRELSQKARLSIYQSIFIPTLNYGYKLWVVTERMRSQIQAADISFLHRVAGLSLRHRVRGSVIWKGLGVESLLLHIERSQLRWFRLLVRRAPGRGPWVVIRACPSSRRIQSRLRTCWRYYVSIYICISVSLGRPQCSLWGARGGDRGERSGPLCSGLYSRDPNLGRRKLMDGWLETDPEWVWACVVVWLCGSTMDYQPVPGEPLPFIRRQLRGLQQIPVTFHVCKLICCNSTIISLAGWIKYLSIFFFDWVISLLSPQKITTLKRLATQCQKYVKLMDDFLSVLKQDEMKEVAYMNKDLWHFVKLSQNKWLHLQQAIKTTCGCCRS